MTDLTATAKALAAQEAASASSRGDTKTVAEVRRIVVPDDTDIAARADFVHDTTVADAETIGHSGRWWPFS